MIHGRQRIGHVIAALCLTALSGSVLVAAPTFAEPDIKTVQARVDRLYHEAEVASERYNGARERLLQARSHLRSLRGDLGRQRHQMRDVRRQVTSAVLAEYQGQTLTSTTQVLLARDPNKFLGRLATVSQYHDQQTQMMARFATASKQLEMRSQAADRETARIARTKTQLATEKAAIYDKASQAKDLLGQLKDQAKARAAARARAAERAAARAAAAARAQRPSRDTSPSPAPSPAPSTPSPGGSGRAASVVSYAMAQVGDAYVYGASGPSAFDCSGLTMMAWRQAGVSLPHSSSSQMSSGTPVSSSQLQPGDLVFYYSPVSHVGIYIGNGRIVHAANPSDGVLTAPVFSMPYSGAVRPG